MEIKQPSGFSKRRDILKRLDVSVVAVFVNTKRMDVCKIGRLTNSEITLSLSIYKFIWPF